MLCVENVAVLAHGAREQQRQASGCVIGAAESLKTENGIENTMNMKRVPPLLL